MINIRIGVGEYIEILNTTAPSSTTNKLYRVGSSLYWNGNELGGGVTPTINESSITNPAIDLLLDSSSDRIQILTSDANKSIILLDDATHNDFFIIRNNNTSGSTFLIKNRISEIDYNLDYVGTQETKTYRFIKDRWHIDNTIIYENLPGTDRRLICGRGNNTNQDFNSNYSVGSTIFGNYNTISGDNKIIVGHDNSFNNYYVSTGVIIGASNTAQAGGVIIGHGNISGNPGNIIIGYSNNINSNAIVVGEVTGTVGLNNIVTLGTVTYQGNIGSTISIGRTNTLSANSTYSHVIGYNCISESSNQFTQGYYSKAIRYGEQIRTPNGGSGYTGSSYGTCILEGLFNNTNGNLPLLGSVGSMFILKESSILNFSVRLVIYEYDTPTPVAALGGYTWRGVIGVSPAGVGSFIGVPVEESWLEVGFGDATCSISIVDSTPDYFNIAYTKNTSTKNVYIMATIEYTELNLASR